MIKVLVVDDYATNGVVVKKALTQGKYEVKTYTSAIKALQYLETGAEVNLILLDINMPEMDGITALKRIRAKEKCKDMPILFLSGTADRDKVMRGFREGVDDIVAKPVIPKLLNDRVERALAGNSPVQLYKRSGITGSYGSVNNLYESLIADFDKVLGKSAEPDSSPAIVSSPLSGSGVLANAIKENSHSSADKAKSDSPAASAEKASLPHSGMNRIKEDRLAMEQEAGAPDIELDLPDFGAEKKEKKNEDNTAFGIDLSGILDGGSLW